MPSIEAAKIIADSLEVSLDHLVGKGVLKGFDKKTLHCIHDLEHLEEDKKKTFQDLIDTYIRDAKVENPAKPTPFRHSLLRLNWHGGIGSLLVYFPIY